MVTSTNLRLTPLSTGQILDHAVRLYRRNFLRFIGIFAVVQVPAALINIIASARTSTSLMDYINQAYTPTFDEAFWTTYLTSLFLTLIIGVSNFVLVQVIGTAALTKTVTSYLTRQPTDILDAYSNTSKDWLRLLVVAIIVAFVTLAALLWTIFVPCVGWITGPSILVFLIMALTPLTIPIVVLEKKGGGAALRRAWDLARRRFWPLIGFTLILTVFAQFLIAGPAALVRSVLYVSINATQDAASQSMTIAIVDSIVKLFLSLLFNPLQLTAFTLMYYDLRVRTEGFDLAVLARQTSCETASTPVDYDALIAHSPPAESSPLLTGGDYGRFALISILVVVFYTVLMFILGLMMLALFASMSGY